MKGETLGTFILLSVLFWFQNLQVCRSHHATCDRTYSKVDCVYTYQNRKRIYNELILTDRDRGSSKYSGIPTDWAHWEEYLLGLVCRCTEKLKRISDGNITIYNQFTIENYGECWSTKYSYDSLHTLARSNNCIGAGYLNCPTESMSECTGIELSSSLYRIHNRSKPLDEHCHIERKIVCPSSVLIYNSSFPSRMIKSSKFVFSPHRSSLIGSTPLAINSTSFQLSQATRLKFSSVGTTLYESMIIKLTNQTHSMASEIHSLNTRQLYTSGSKLPNITLAPTQFLIATSRNKTKTAKFSIIESTKTYHITSINLTRSSETKGSLDVGKSQQQSIPTKTSIQEQAANESYNFHKEPSLIGPSVIETSSITPSSSKISATQPSTKERSYTESLSKGTGSIGPATNSEAILETRRLNFSLSSIKTNRIEAISVLILQSERSQNLSTENNKKILSSIPHTLLSSLSSWQPSITSIATTSQASDLITGDATPSSVSYKSQLSESKVRFVLWSKSFEESSNVDSIQTNIQGSHSSKKQESHEKSMTPLLNSASTDATIEIFKSSTSLPPSKSFNIMSTNELNEASVSSATIVELPTSLSAQQSSSFLVRAMSSAMQKSMSNHINASYENKITASSDFKTILDTSILQTVKNKQTETPLPSIMTTLTSSFTPRYSENFGYNTTTDETSSSKSQLKNFSPNYHVTKPMINITTNESTSFENHSTTLLEPKQSFVGISSSSSVVPSTQPSINCKNARGTCKKNSGTNAQLSVKVLVVIAIQLMLIRLVSLSFG